MSEIQCMIKELEKMAQEGIKEIFIYYAEDMTHITNNMWSLDVMCNRINNACGPMSWTWTVISVEEEKAYHEEYDDDTLPADYDIIVDESFSDDVVCKAIQTWLSDNGLGNYGFNVVMIDLKDATPYSGYVKSLMNRDLDEEIRNAEPLFMD